MQNSFGIFFALTLVSYMIGKLIYTKQPKLPVLVGAMISLGLLLTLFDISYKDFYAKLEPLFQTLTGLSLVLLAWPLANLSRDQFNFLKKNIGIILFASISGVLLPIIMAWIIFNKLPFISAFSTRAISTPFAITVSTIIQSPLQLAVLIVIFSGVFGALLLPVLLKSCKDDRVYGLIMGLAAHAIGTAQAWQKSQLAGQYAAAGMMLNGVVTTLWLPACWQYFIQPLFNRVI